MFRIGFGAMTAWEGIRYLDRGWVDAFYGSTTYTFTYWPFDFVQPLPGPLRPLPWILMIVAGLGLIVGGRFRRAAAVLAWLTLSYTLLIDKSQYLNHVYLMALLAFLLIWVRPHHRGLLAFQVALPYTYAGLAKLNGDWLDGRPLDEWLDLAPGAAIAVAWAAAAFDLGVVPALVWSRTRAIAYLVTVVFHVLNARLFSIGVFPWLMIIATTILLPPAWPRLIVADLRSRTRRGLAATGGAVAGAAVGVGFYPSVVAVHVLVAAFGFGLAAWLLAGGLASEPSRSPWGRPTSKRTVAFAAASLWVAIQLLVPLRHHLYDGNAHWTEEARRFSWHMKLRSKDATVVFYVDGHEIDLTESLTDRQISKMAARPDMIIQFAHELERRAGTDIVVTVDSLAALNGRSVQRFVRAGVDLTEIERAPVESLLPPT